MLRVSNNSPYEMNVDELNNYGIITSGIGYTHLLRELMEYNEVTVILKSGTDKTLFTKERLSKENVYSIKDLLDNQIQNLKDVVILAETNDSPKYCIKNPDTLKKYILN